ncbi:uncharacterized protein BDR25DRAFT_226920, partial [Lindgomyces ingoldianus]
FLLLRWPRTAIANCKGCSLHAVHNVENNLKAYSSVYKLPTIKLRRPSKISNKDGKALFKELICSRWRYQDKQAY